MGTPHFNFKQCKVPILPSVLLNGWLVDWLQPWGQSGVVLAGVDLPKLGVLSPFLSLCLFLPRLSYTGSVSVSSW